MNGPPTAPDQPARDGSIDLLRSLLVLYVVAYLHLGGYIGDGEQHVQGWTPAVTNMVLGTFTFLSGYVLGIWNGPKNLTGIRRYYWRRFLRIYPLYLLALAGFVLLWLAKPMVAIKAAFGVSMFWPPPPMTLWFVTMIVVCYFLAPLIIMPRPRIALPAAAGLWLGMLAFNFTIHQIDPRMLTQFAAFAAGVAYRRIGDRHSATNKLLLLAVAFLASLTAAIATLQLPLLGAVTAVPSVVAGPILLLLLADRLPEGLRGHRVVAFLSYVSFSAYLFHRIVFELIVRKAWPETDLSRTLTLLFLGVPCVLLFSAIVQALYDRLTARLSSPDRLFGAIAEPPTHRH